MDFTNNKPQCLQKLRQKQGPHPEKHRAPLSGNCTSSVLLAEAPKTEEHKPHFHCGSAEISTASLTWDKLIMPHATHHKVTICLLFLMGFRTLLKQHPVEPS